MFIVMAFITVFGYQAKSQGCYEPISGQGVTVSGVGNGALCTSILCLGEQNYSELRKIIDTDLKTAGYYP